jgi:hypothetical protein
LYDRTKLTYRPNFSGTTRSAYPSDLGRPLQNLYFSQAEGRDFRIINAHIPGDPSLPCREEFASYVHRQHQNGSVTIAVGDNNFDREEMIEAYRKAGFSDFSLHTPWKTNIDPMTKQSKGIDHLFVVGEDNSRDLVSSEILVCGNLQETIDLLNQEKL